MKMIEIRNTKNEPVVTFDGTTWRIFDERSSVFELEHSYVEECPYYLVAQIEFYANAKKICDELSTKSKSLKNLFDSYRTELAELEKRVVLFEKEASGMTSCFSDKLTLAGNLETGLTLQTMLISHDWWDYEYPQVNAMGEMMIDEFPCFSNIPELYDTLKEFLTTDDRWSDVNWSWEEILENMNESSPKCGKELAQMIKEDETNDLLE